MCHNCPVKPKLQAGTKKHGYLIVFGIEESVQKSIPSLANPMITGYGLKVVLQLKENKGKR